MKEGTARASWRDKALEFDAVLAPILSDIQVDGNSVADITANIACRGSFAPAREQPLSGTLTIDVESPGVSLQTVASRVVQLAGRTIEASPIDR